jgi:hypothetical protein
MQEIEELRRALNSTRSSKTGFPGTSLGNVPQGLAQRRLGDRKILARGILTVWLGCSQ